MVTKRSRPTMPEGYGIHPDSNGMLNWIWVRNRMALSRNYWVATTRPSGNPHVTPVWGIWLNDVFFFNTDGRSRKALNLSINSGIVVHLESGDDVVIVEGNAEELADPSLRAVISDAYLKKYGMPLADLGGSASFTVRPRVVMAWLERDFPNTATRWIIRGSEDNCLFSNPKTSWALRATMPLLNCLCRGLIRMSRQTWPR